MVDGQPPGEAAYVISKRSVRLAFGAVLVAGAIVGAFLLGRATAPGRTRLAGVEATTTVATPAPVTTIQSSTTSTGVTTTASTVAPTTTAPPLPVLFVPSHYGSPGFDGRYPRTIAFSADGGNIVGGISWSAWGATEAVGHGTWTYQNCIPDCAQGSQTPYPATITLSLPAGGRYTRLVEETGGPQTFSAIDYLGTGSWPLGASSS